MASHKIVIDGNNLKIKDVVAVARGKMVNGKPVYPVVELDPDAKKQIDRVRKYIEDNWLTEGADAYYGFNTGCGKLKDYRLSTEEIDEFNKSYIRAHCVGTGDLLPKDVVRASLLLRANTFAKGYSGIRSDLVIKILELLNKDVIPAVPELGSLGASGDLAPLAYMAAVIIGEEQAHAFYGGKKMKALDALKMAGIEPLSLKAKEAMSFTNGSTVSLAVCCLLSADAVNMLQIADVVASLSLEAMRCEKAAFDSKIHQLRKHSGQFQSARNIRKLTDSSEWMTEEARQEWSKKVSQEGKESSPRVQDAYSIRCLPSVHGSCRDSLNYLNQTISVEINSAIDSPLVFQTDSGYEMLNGGNFFGQQLAISSDLLAIAMVKIGQISERRTFRLLNPAFSFGLPDQLTGDKPGVNTGLMVAHYAQAAILSKCKVLASPASIHSEVTSGGQEDIVSMSLTSALKAAEILEHTFSILATELFCAFQGTVLARKILGDRPMGKGTQIVFDYIASHLKEIKKDRYLHDDLQQARELLTSSQLLDKVEDLLMVEES